MKEWTFELNGKPMSGFKIGATLLPAFSGLGQNINRRISACVPSYGPIPTDFQSLSTSLRCQTRIGIEGTDMNYLAKVVVR